MEEKRNAFTVETLAERWACSRDMIYKLIREGRLKVFRLGSSVRIPYAEVERIEQSGKA